MERKVRSEPSSCAGVHGQALGDVAIMMDSRGDFAWQRCAAGQRSLARPC